MKTNSTTQWLVQDDREVYSAPPWITIHRQRLLLPNGRIVEDYHQIALRDYVIIVAQTTDGKYIAERQYKHGIGKVSLLLPGGVIEAGEEPLLAARRELLEETGYEADNWRALGVYVSDANYGCGNAHFFVASNARKVADPDSGDLEDMQIVLMDATGLIEAVRTGEILAVGAVAAVAWALNPAMIAVP
jgi:ADP-ribose pyrophosphatase